MIPFPPQLDMPPCATQTEYRIQDAYATEKVMPFCSVGGVLSQYADLLSFGYREKAIINNLDSLSCEILKPIPVVVQEEDGAFVASFVDTNIGITGDTKEEAVENLRFLLADMFDDLENQESQLGPHPQHQLAIMRSFMQKRL